MFVFRKIWRALFTCNTRFEIRRFASLPTILLPACIINHYFPFNASYKYTKIRGFLAFSGVIEIGNWCENWLMRVLEWMCWWKYSQTFHIEISQLVLIANLLVAMRCAIWYHLHNLKNVKNRLLMPSAKQNKNLYVTSIITRFFAVVPISALFYVISWDAWHFPS